MRLGVERTISQPPLPIPGGSVSPADSDSPCRTAGGALGAGRPSGPRRHELVVRAGECQCCGRLVPAAHRSL